MGTECTLSTFAEDTNLGRVADTPGGCADIQWDIRQAGELGGEKCKEIQQESCTLLEQKLCQVEYLMDFQFGQTQQRKL